MNPLIPAIISIVESIFADAPPPSQPPPYAVVRSMPQSAPLAVMGPPANGYARFGDKTLHLAANLQIRDTQNRIIVPVAVQQAVPVLYKLDANGSVQRVWVLTPEEAEVAEQVIRQKTASPK